MFTRFASVTYQRKALLIPHDVKVFEVLGSFWMPAPIYIISAVDQSNHGGTMGKGEKITSQIPETASRTVTP